MENSARRDVVLVLEGEDIAEPVGDAAAYLDVADPFALVAEVGEVSRTPQRSAS